MTTAVLVLVPVVPASVVVVVVVVPGAVTVSVEVVATVAPGAVTVSVKVVATVVPGAVTVTVGDAGPGPGVVVGGVPIATHEQADEILAGELSHWET